MIRAAAKNHAFAAVVVEPEAYDAVLEELRVGDGLLSLPTRARRSPPRRSPTPRATTRRSRAGSPSAARTSRRCSCAPTRRSSTSPTARTRTSARRTTSRSARACTCCRWCASTTASSCRTTTCSTSTRRARSCDEFEVPGVRDRQAQQPLRRGASARTALEAYQRAFACDPLSAFGGIIALNRPRRPAAGRGARRAVRRGAVRARLRRRRARGPDRASRTCASSQDEERRAPLAGEPEITPGRPAGCSCRTATLRLRGPRARWRSSPSASRPRQEWSDMLFAWRVCKHVRSNAIVLAKRPRDGRHRRRADEPRRLGAARRREGRGRTRCRARRSPPTRSSRSPTAPSWRSTAGVDADHPARRLGARSPTSSRPPTRPAIAMVFTRRRHFRH